MTPPFSLFDQAEDRFEDLAWGQVLVTPFELGAWALLEPMGEQNHAPQLLLDPARSVGLCLDGRQRRGHRWDVGVSVSIGG